MEFSHLQITTKQKPCCTKLLKRSYPIKTQVEAPPHLERNTKSPDETQEESPTTTREKPTHCNKKGVH